MNKKSGKKLKRKENVIVIPEETNVPVIKKIGQKYNVLKKLVYKDVPKTTEGWINASLYIPEDQDLVHIKVLDKPDMFGWVNGETWDGYKLKKGDKVLFWKRNDENHTI